MSLCGMAIPKDLQDFRIFLKKSSWVVEVDFLFHVRVCKLSMTWLNSFVCR